MDDSREKGGGPLTSFFKSEEKCIDHHVPKRRGSISRGKKRIGFYSRVKKKKREKRKYGGTIPALRRGKPPSGSKGNASQRGKKTQSILWGENKGDRKKEGKTVANERVAGIGLRGGRRQFSGRGEGGPCSGIRPLLRVKKQKGQSMRQKEGEIRDLQNIRLGQILTL